MRVDTTEQYVGVVDRAERMFVEQGEIENEVYDGLFRWVREEYMSKVKELVPRNGFGRDKKLAEASRDLARVLYIFSKDNNEKRRRRNMEKLVGTMFDYEDKDSLVNCCGERNREEVLSGLYGTISVLTAINLFEEASPGVVSQMSIGEIIAPADMDVRHKVDLILEFKEKGREHVRLVQLKSDPEQNVLIAEAYKGDKRRVLGVSDKSIDSMFGVANTISENRRKMGIDVGVKVFVMVVPHVGSGIVNIFGGLSDDGLYDVFVEDLGKRGRGRGLLPVVDNVRGKVGGRYE